MHQTIRSSWKSSVGCTCTKPPDRVAVESMNPSLEDRHFELMESYQYYQLKTNNSSSRAGEDGDHQQRQQQYSSSQLDQLCSMEKKKRGAGGKRSGTGGVKLSTDPQSVAARQRRHRISDRFRVLKSLVPGGSKMDTVSMLEEAIHYVKFLKAQIWLHQSAALMSINPPDAGVPFLPSSAHQSTSANYNTSNSVTCAVDNAGSAYHSPPQMAAPHDQMLNYYVPPSAVTPSLPAFASCPFQEDDMPFHPYFNY